jgi:hypothetical protein
VESGADGGAIVCELPSEVRGVERGGSYERAEAPATMGHRRPRHALADAAAGVFVRVQGKIEPIKRGSAPIAFYHPAGLP